MTAGANSIFHGEKLLTTANTEVDEDDKLFAHLQDTELAASWEIFAKATKLSWPSSKG